MENSVCKMWIWLIVHVKYDINICGFTLYAKFNFDLQQFPTKFQIMLGFIIDIIKTFHRSL